MLLYENYLVIMMNGGTVEEIPGEKNNKIFT